MKTVFLLLFLSVGVAATAIAQCCPYINGIEVLPAMPTDDDSVYVMTTVTTPNQGEYLGESHFVFNDTIYIDACYYSGMLTALETYIDTINVGLLAPGTYHVKLTARISNDFNQCVPTGQFQDSVFAPFEVTVSNDINDLHQPVVSVYPNPASDVLNLKHNGLEVVSVVNAAGGLHRPRLIAVSADLAQVSIAELPDGFYTVTLRDKNGGLHRVAFVKD